jgi:hypothetical protein
MLRLLTVLLGRLVAKSPPASLAVELDQLRASIVRISGDVQSANAFENALLDVAMRVWPRLDAPVLGHSASLGLAT